MIHFDSVTKHYGLVNGANDVCMDIGPGAYGLLGENGSGKTTLINLITGQLRPTIGKVTVFGEDPWGKEQMLRKIGLCPAVDVLYSNVSAFEWVNYQTRLIGFTWAEAKNRTLQALSTVGMTDAMHRKIGGYSLGMRQRTKLAQAIAHEPQLLILDEPFNGLDPIGRQEMTELLKDYVKQERSVILASHVLHEVEAIDPALLLLSKGRLLAQGSAHEIREILSTQQAQFTDLGSGAIETTGSFENKKMLEVYVRSSDNYLLAQKLMALTRLSSVRLSANESELTLGTTEVSETYHHIAKIAAEDDLEFHELRSADGSLDDLFSSLMKIHRGEN
ncbi:MAG: ABC transporter ATP-binding protein [Planctomycetota bacterium]|nr:ABC transporter ATP-binding protein [Planctomycetota bacterium]